MYLEDSCWRFFATGFHLRQGELLLIRRFALILLKRLADFKQQSDQMNDSNSVTTRVTSVFQEFIHLAYLVSLLH